jgi:hypothetical protein
MSTSQRTFEQVKNILGKLDNNIDAARARRLQTRIAPAPVPAPAPMMVQPPAPVATPLPAASPSMIGQSNGAAPARSMYGRAQPMRTDNRPSRA